MLATMDDVQYNEHKLAEKAQRIIDIRQDLQELERRKEQLSVQRPIYDKDQLTYKESIEFGKKADRYKEELRQIEVEILKLKRQLSALEHQAQKLMPVSGVKIKVSKYSSEGQPTQTYCVKKKRNIGRSDSDSVIHVEKL